MISGRDAIYKKLFDVAQNIGVEMDSEEESEKTLQ